MADVELEEGLGRPHQACNHVQCNTLCHSSQGYAVTRVSIRCTLVKVRCALSPLVLCYLPDSSPLRISPGHPKAIQSARIVEWMTANTRLLLTLGLLGRTAGFTLSTASFVPSPSGARPELLRRFSAATYQVVCQP